MTSGLIRDLFSDDIERVVIDSRRDSKEILSYLRDTAPQLRDRVHVHNETEPIFDYYKIEDEIEKATNRRVPLSQGGFLVIDHTEAMVTIDVNSGRYVGHANQEATIFSVNMAAATEVARQLKLRDIGGIIVVDFIDMMLRSNRRKLWDSFVRAMSRDRARTDVASEISEFGLLEMTRQRVRPSLLHTFSEPCPTCDGQGRVQGIDTTVTKVERWLKRARVQGEERRVILELHPDAAEYLEENHGRRLKTLRRATRMRVDIDREPDMILEDFRFYSASTEEEITDKYVG
jgi:ribonuclease G